MTNTQHTQGAWHYDREREAVVDEHRKNVADVNMSEHGPVLAASRDMLAALEGARKAIDRLFALAIEQSCFPDVFLPSKSGQAWEALLAINAAITKATTALPLTEQELAEERYDHCRIDAETDGRGDVDGVN